MTLPETRAGGATVEPRDGKPVVLATCRGCSKPLTLPCQSEEGGWFEPDALALKWAEMLVCEDCHLADEEHRQQRDSRRAVEDRVRSAGVPESFHGLRFEDMDRSGGRDRAVSAAWAWADASDGAGLLVWGPPGTGKSRLAATAIWTRLQRRPAVWCSVAHLIASLQAAFSDRDRQQALRTLTGRQALVLDDLDKVRVSEAVLSQLFVAIDRRVGAGAPLLVTSNAPPARLTEQFGAAITSRLLGYCLTVELGGPDRRLREAT